MTYIHIYVKSRRTVSHDKQRTWIRKRSRSVIAPKSSQEKNLWIYEPMDSRRMVSEDDAITIAIGSPTPCQAEKRQDWTGRTKRLKHRRNIETKWEKRHKLPQTDSQNNSMHAKTGIYRHRAALSFIKTDLGTTVQNRDGERMRKTRENSDIHSQHPNSLLEIMSCECWVLSIAWSGLRSRCAVHGSELDWILS